MRVQRSIKGCSSLFVFPIPCLAINRRAVLFVHVYFKQEQMLADRQSFHRATCTSFMHSSTPLRVLRAQTSKQLASRRFASHGAPHYNEPSGYLFAEKVKTSVAMLFV